MRAETPINTIIISISIIGILLFAGLALPGLIGKSDSSRVKAAQSQMSRLIESVESYKTDVGRLPSNLEALVKNIDQIDDWNGPYIKSSSLIDPWGTGYLYKSSGTSFVIESYGVDKRKGGEDYSADLATNSGTSG